MKWLKQKKFNKFNRTGQEFIERFRDHCTEDFLNYPAKANKVIEAIAGWDGQSIIDIRKKDVYKKLLEPERKIVIGKDHPFFKDDLTKG